HRQRSKRADGHHRHRDIDQGQTTSFVKTPTSHITRVAQYTAGAKPLHPLVGNIWGRVDTQFKSKRERLASDIARGRAADHFTIFAPPMMPPLPSVSS